MVAKSMTLLPSRLILITVAQRYQVVTHRQKGSINKALEHFNQYQVIPIKDEEDV